MKNGVRSMRRWDTEIPVVRRERPNLQILTCHDEYLLHTMFDVDGAVTLLFAIEMKDRVLED